MQVIESKLVAPIFTKPAPLQATELLPSKSDAAIEGSLVVSGFRAGARAVIDACVRTAQAIQRFHNDQSAIDDFLAPLVDGNVISSSEARLGLASPKLSKFRAIGHNAEMLCHEQVFRYLPPAYTVIYHVTVLYSVLEGDEPNRFDRLTRELDSLSPLSREALIARTEEIKRAKKATSTLPSVLQEEGSDADVHPTANRWANYKLVLLTPDRKRDFGRLVEQDVTQTECYRLGSELLSEEATAVVVAELADIPFIEDKLLSIFRFSHVSHVFLVREPTQADVTDAQVLIVAHRTQTVFTTNHSWLPASEVLDAKTVAELLVPGAVKKLHLFATERSVGSGGWLSVIGKANWSQADE